MSQAENKESQLEIIDKKTDDFLKTLLNIKVNDEENDKSSSTEDDDASIFGSDGSLYAPSETSDDSSVSDASKSIESAISKIFPSFKKKDYQLRKQSKNRIAWINKRFKQIEKEIKDKIEDINYHLDN